MKLIKEIKDWKKLWSVWALVLGPFVGYGVSWLNDIIEFGPSGVLEAVVLVILSVIGLGTRLIAQPNVGKTK